MLYISISALLNNTDLNNTYHSMSSINVVLSDTSIELDPESEASSWNDAQQVGFRNCSG